MNGAPARLKSDYGLKNERCPIVFVIFRFQGMLVPGISS